MMRPSFDSLPLQSGDAPYSAWGLYGKNDQLGTLNLLTPAVVAEAAKDIKTGIRVGLNLPLDIPSPGSHNRYFKHRIIYKAPRAVHDDVIEMNTQCSTQWDGFRHFGYQKANCFYNGYKPEDFQGSEGASNIGIHSWCAQGIAGRGVLLDYLAWTELNNIKFDPFDTHKIPLTDLLACAKSQNLSFKHGDILLIRLGWKGRYMALDQQSRDAMPLQVPHKAAGVEASVDMARWLWDTGFSACAGDTAAFEVFPTSDPSGKGGLGGLILHEIMLGGWGMPIGEMFDLDELSKECIKQGRWTFFLTSMPLNIPGGVASPANIMAIF